VKEVDPSSTIFAVMANYVYDTTSVATAAPYGDKGFVVCETVGVLAFIEKIRRRPPAGIMTSINFRLPLAGGRATPMEL
jgi:hypothetical protein